MKNRIIALLFTVIMVFSAMSVTAFAYTVDFSGGDFSPSAPVVTVWSTTSTTVTLSWDGVRYADAYSVYQYDRTNWKWILLDEVSGGRYNSTETYTVKGLKPSTEYIFSVTSMKDTGSYGVDYDSNGAYIYGDSNYIDVARSEWVYVTTDMDEKDSGRIELSAPVGLASDNLTNGKMKLTWTEVKKADGYYIYIFDYTTKRTSTFTSETNSYSATDLISGQQYAISVAAYTKNANGKHKIHDKSEQLKVTYEEDASVPKISSATDITADSITLNWEKIKGVNMYRVLIYDATAKKYVKYEDVRTNTCTVTGLTKNTKYRFKVATLALINGNYKETATSDPYIVSTSSKATAATSDGSVNVTAESVTANSVTLKWNKVDGISAYCVYKYDSATGKYKQYKVVKNSTSCTVSDLKAGTEYKFKVYSMKLVDGKYKKVKSSATIKVTTKAASASATANTAIEVNVSATTENSVTLKWNKAEGADAYCVYKYDTSAKKYKQYKVVKSGTSCTVSDLKAGTEYKFKVSSLQLVDGKYKPLSSDTVKATTKAKSSSSGSTAKPSEFNAPIFGGSVKENIKSCGLGYYTAEKQSDGTTDYIGTSLFNGVETYTVLSFNSSKKLYSSLLYIKCSFAEYLSVWSTLTESYSSTIVDDYVVFNCFDLYDVWIKYDTNTGYMVYSMTNYDN